MDSHQSAGVFKDSPGGDRSQCRYFRYPAGIEVLTDALPIIGFQRHSTMTTVVGDPSAKPRESQCFKWRGLSEISHSCRGCSPTREQDPRPLQTDIHRQGKPPLFIHSLDADRAVHPLEQKESSRLVDLCNNITKRLNDHSLVPQQSKYEDIRRPAYCPLSSYTPLM